MKKSIMALNQMHPWMRLFSVPRSVCSREDLIPPRIDSCSCRRASRPLVTVFALDTISSWDIIVILQLTTRCKILKLALLIFTWNKILSDKEFFLYVQEVCIPIFIWRRPSYARYGKMLNLIEIKFGVWHSVCPWSHVHFYRASNCIIWTRTIGHTVNQLLPDPRGTSVV